MEESHHSIKTKRQMYDLLIAGKLGNTLHQWRTPLEMLDSGYRGLFGVRNASTASQPIGVFREHTDNLMKVCFDLSKDGRDVHSDFIFTEVPPDDYRVIQGELCCIPSGLYFYHTFKQEYMRTALQKTGRHAYGLEALALLQTFCQNDTVDELRWLLEAYPGHVIEFTAYSKSVGLYLKKHVIWEVRDY